MRRTSLAWLMLGGMGLALWACGDGGSGTGLPPSEFGTGTDDGYGNFNEPPGTDNEVAASFNEGASCGAEERIALSDLLMEISVPMCEFVESCAEDVSPVPPPQDMPSGGTMHTMDLVNGFAEIPSFCVELARDQSGQDSNECHLTKALADVAGRVPACEQYTVPQKGLCLAAYTRCVHDIIASGCSAYRSEQFPRSCAQVITEESDVLQ